MKTCLCYLLLRYVFGYQWSGVVHLLRLLLPVVTLYLWISMEWSGSPYEAAVTLCTK